MNTRNIAVLLTAMIAVAGCGGGGGTSTPLPVAPTPVVTPAPTVTLALSQSKVSLGSSSTVTWSSTNATSCTASGAWSGTQAISGTSPQTPTASGALTYTLTCTGAGGTVNQTATLTVPIPALKSSYENKMVAATAIGPQVLPGEVFMGNAVAFGDFFQDGSYSMVTHTLIYDPSKPSTFSNFGAIHFYKSVDGKWVDHTADILKDNSGCLHPRKAIVGDFNHDGIPDVFFGCTGADTNPSPGERPHYLLSKVDGTYENVVLPFACHCHGVASADFNANGAQDILVTDPWVAKRPYFLKNDGTGHFTQDFTRLSIDQGELVPSTAGATWTAAIWTIELIDVYNTGRYDAFIAGTEPIPNVTGAISGNWKTSIYKNDGKGNYPEANRVIIPTDGKYDSVLDVTIVNGKMYLDRVIDGDPTRIYIGAAIQRIDLVTMTNEGDIYAHSGDYNVQPSPWINWINWIIPYQGKIYSLNSALGVSVPQ